METKRFTRAIWPLVAVASLLLATAQLEDTAAIDARAAAAADELIVALTAAAQDLAPQ